MGCCGSASDVKPVRVAPGADLTVEVDVVDQDKVILDLTGGSAVMTIKITPTDSTPIAVLSTADATQALILDPSTDGKVQFFLTQTLTAGLEQQTYSFDVWVTLASGKRYQVVPPSDLIVGCTDTTF